MITKTSTISQFRDELREWVKFRRRMADEPSELPSPSALERLASNTISNMLKRTHIEEAKPDIFTWSLFAAAYLSAPVPVLALVAHQRKEPFVIAAFPLEVRYEMAFDRKIPYIHDIGDVQILGSFPTRNGPLSAASTLEDAIFYAAEHTAGLTETEPVMRWLLNVPEATRVQHPICPRCGCESVYIGEFSEDGDPYRTVKRATCSCCSWTSKHKYYYLSEFVEEKSFRKELATVRAEADAQKTVAKAQEDLEVILRRVHGICQDKAVMRHASYEFRQMVKKAAAELKEIAAEAEAVKLGKKS